MDEQRILSLLIGTQVYRQVKNYHDSFRPNESLAVILGRYHRYELDPTWLIITGEYAYLPNKSLYAEQSPGFVRMKPEIHAEIRRVSTETGLVPTVINHCQPIDFPSGQDSDTSKKLLLWYPFAVMGSYSDTFRFFRVAR